MQALSNIKSLHIRATHDENTATSILTNVVLESSKESGKERVYGVEKFNCNYGYTGLSCNECADGFTRQTDGTCGACKCSGKSRKCDPENGKCYNCTGNTDGKANLYFNFPCHLALTPHQTSRWVAMHLVLLDLIMTYNRHTIL